MIELISFFALFAEAAPAAPSFSAEPWIGLLTGSGGCIVALGMWVKTLLADKKEMVERHVEKDKQLIAITREAIECIRGAASRAEDENGFRERVEATLRAINEKLDDVA
jgi:hypothetical protein